jgi:hypothetical protein
MSAGKLIAMLNPRTVRFGGGRGAVADITREDVIAAMASCPFKLAVMILEAVHNPAGQASVRSDNQIYLTIMERLARQRLAQDKERWAADMEYQLARIRLPTRHTEAQALQRYEQATKAMWPRFERDSYEKVVRAVLTEIFEASRCPDCGGSGELPARVGTAARKCGRCEGTGRIELKQHGRAGLMGMHHDQFARRWAQVYDWLLRDLLSELRQASDHIDSYCREQAA